MDYDSLANLISLDSTFITNVGGGGSSSTSSLDSTTIANMIADAGVGGSFGDFISINTTIENQAPSDGFLYGWFSTSSTSMHTRSTSVSIHSCGSMVFIMRIFLPRSPLSLLPRCKNTQIDFRNCRLLTSSAI